MQKILVVTGGRADWGLLTEVCRILEKSDKAELFLAVTGYHFSKIHGNTLDTTLIHDFSNIVEVDIGIKGDRVSDIGKYVSRVIDKFIDLLKDVAPHKVLVLGDRYEILGASIASAILSIPIAHIGGGEVTEGAFDEFIRHSITKMATLHFTSHKDYRKRVIQLGEHPKTVFNVGALGVQNIELLKANLLTKEECESRLGLQFKQKNLLITFHPETNYLDQTFNHLRQLLLALEDIKNTCFIFSAPNADPLFYNFIKEIEIFVQNDKRSRFVFNSLGQEMYFSLLQHVDAVIGNSSSGILEAPSFHLATINIGDRQKGRIRASSVIDVNAKRSEIAFALEKIYSKEFIETLSLVKNPYYKKDTANIIVNKLINENLSKTVKSFYDL